MPEPPRTLEHLEIAKKSEAMRGAWLVAVVIGVCLVSCKPTPQPQRPVAGAAVKKKYEAPDERFALFAIGKADLVADGLFSVGYLAAQLDADPTLHVLIVGHADRGRPDIVRDLCFKRARAVRKLLTDHGIKEARLHVAAPKDQGEGSHGDLGRRVDLFAYDPAQDKVEKRVGYPVEIRDD